jgi:hypothetical protein
MISFKGDVIDWQTTRPIAYLTLMIYVEEANPSAGKVFKDLVHQALVLCFFFPLNRW